MPDPLTFGQTALPAESLQALQKGIMDYRYRGRAMWKCPMDLAIYAEILWDLRPRSVIELGSNTGASALWFADQLTAFGVEGFVVHSFDIRPVTDLADPRLRFGYCDVAAPAQHLPPNWLRSLPKPFLLVDDASHQAAHVLAVLRLMDQTLAPGDYVIIEDGSLSALGLNARYAGGPLVAIAQFLAECQGRFQIDRARCDRFGHNVTWNPEGYLRRV
jgi:cephalosporin hydroxylase